MKRFKYVLAGGILSVAALNYAAVRVFLNMALGRKCILFGKQKESTSAEPEKKQQESEWIASQKMKEISIQSFDGLRLQGHYLEAENAKRILMLFHGWRGSWQHDFGAVLQWLFENGCSLLLVDERAQGKSEGKYMGFGILERRDCHSWMQWMESHREVNLPVYLYGVSMGAAAVLMTAGDQLPAMVKGAIADCGFSSSYDMIKHFGLQNMKLREHPVMDELNLLCRRRAGYDLKEYTPLEAMEHCQVPVLFIHGKADTFVPCEMTLQNYQACTAKKKLLMVEDADHCMSMQKDRETYLCRLTEFFTEIESES